MTALFRDYVRDWNLVHRFYPENYSIQSVIDFARQHPPLEASHREKLCTALFAQQKQWGAQTSSVEKLHAGAIAILTGQQPGLFTGPTYTILKALTVIKLAQALDQAGVAAVPVFWIAAEDHDFQEIEWASVLDRDSSVQMCRVDLSNEEFAPAGWLALKSDVTECIGRCLSSLPESEFQPEIREILEAAYAPGASTVDAFARMMAKLFAGTELLLVNPLQSDLRNLSIPALNEAVHKNSEIRSAVIARSRALHAAGYHEQVKVDDNFTGIFAYRGRSRQPLRPSEIRTDAPLSPNVLLRPAVQDAIFPTAAYVGGPAEIAYFAQAAAVYETLGRRVPPVVPRISATIIEPRVARALKKYDLEISDVFRGRDFMKRKAVENIDDDLIFDEVRERVAAELERLRPALTGVDPTLAGALDTSRQKAVHQVEALHTRFVIALARRNETLDKHLTTISNSIFPEKKLQERVINVTSFLVRYGLGFVKTLEQAVTLDAREHQVIEI